MTSLSVRQHAKTITAISAITMYLFLPGNSTLLPSLSTLNDPFSIATLALYVATEQLTLYFLRTQNIDLALPLSTFRLLVPSLVLPGPFPVILEAAASSALLLMACTVSTSSETSHYYPFFEACVVIEALFPRVSRDVTTAITPVQAFRQGNWALLTTFEAFLGVRVMLGAVQSIVVGVREDGVFFNVEEPRRSEKGFELARKMGMGAGWSEGEKGKGRAWFLGNLNGILLTTWLAGRLVYVFLLWIGALSTEAACPLSS